MDQCLKELAFHGYDKRPTAMSHWGASRYVIQSGRYWTRTSDFYDVNVALYQLS